MAWSWKSWQNQGPFEVRFLGLLVSNSFCCWLCVSHTGSVTLGKSFSPSDPQVPRGLRFLPHRALCENLRRECLRRIRCGYVPWQTLVT